MAVFLKILCFVIWLVIMMVLIHGSRKKKSALRETVYVQLTEDDDLEMILRYALWDINTRDSLIIEDISRMHKRNSLIAAFMKRRNPAIDYYNISENC